jgi:hypothetical protein
MQHKRWSAGDLAKLKNLAQKVPASQVAAELGRGLSATRVKAHEMRVSLRMKKNAARDFTSADNSCADQSVGSSG